jgi:hypothetical protein
VGKPKNCYEGKLEYMTREELIEKVQNQRVELRNMLCSAERGIKHSCEQALVIRAAIKLLQPKHRHTAAYSVLTNTCRDGTTVLREIAEASYGDV